MGWEKTWVGMVQVEKDWMAKDMDGKRHGWQKTWVARDMGGKRPDGNTLGGKSPVARDRVAKDQVAKIRIPCVCVRVCVRACVFVHVFVYVCVCMYVSVSVVADKHSSVLPGVVCLLRDGNL